MITWVTPKAIHLSGTTSALFAEDQLFLREDLTATAGLRLDHHSKFGNHYSPRLYLVYHPAPASTINGGVSQDKRAPSQRKIDGGGDLTPADAVCGSLKPLGYVSGSGDTAGNADSQAKNRHGRRDREWRGNRMAGDVDLIYFHTDFKNKIDYAPLGFYLETPGGPR